MKSMLITGGAGFIGTHLAAEAIKAGYIVKIIDNLSPQIHGTEASYKPNPEAEFVKGDVTSRQDMQNSLDGVDIVVHLAAETGTGQSMYEIERYYGVNVQATALLFDILANHRHRVSKVILASSRSVYGEGAYLCRNCSAEGKRCFPSPRSPEQLASHDWEPRCTTCQGTVTPTATREDDKLSPASIYAATKLAQEDLVRIGCSSLGISHAILRFQNVYGEGQSLSNPYTGILSIFSTRIRLGLPLPIFEDGHETRDFVHVQDIAKAVIRCAEGKMPSGHVVNAGMGKPTSIMAVAQLLCRLMDSSIEPHVSAQYRVGDIRHNFADISRLQNIVGFTPEVSLEQGMARFCQWVSTQPVPQDLLDKANAELKARKMMG